MVAVGSAYLAAMTLLLWCVALYLPSAAKLLPVPAPLRCVHIGKWFASGVAEQEKKKKADEKRKRWTLRNARFAAVPHHLYFARHHRSLFCRRIFLPRRCHIACLQHTPVICDRNHARGFMLLLCDIVEHVNDSALQRARTCAGAVLLFRGAIAGGGWDRGDVGQR